VKRVVEYLPSSAGAEEEEEDRGGREGDEERQGRLPFGTAYHVPVVCKEVCENYVNEENLRLG